jgi:hypothetical protein
MLNRHKGVGNKVRQNMMDRRGKMKLVRMQDKGGFKPKTRGLVGNIIGREGNKMEKTRPITKGVTKGGSVKTGRRTKVLKGRWVGNE